MTYTFSYDGTNRPKWDKVFTATNGETFSANLTFHNEIDRNNLSAIEVYSHINNLVQYVKDRTTELSIIELSDSPPSGMWPFHGRKYEEIEWAMDELLLWWNWAYFNDAFEESA